MKPQKQKVVSKGMGDCLAACMASLLELPLEVMPNDHTENWFSIWRTFLSTFGLAITFQSERGPIWAEYPWIASVKSLNYDCTHAIVMEDHKVLFDPSTKKRYRKGTSLLGSNRIVGGYIITVADFTKLHKLEEYRKKLKSAS